QHFRGKIDADDLEMAAIGRQRQAGADADLEHAALALVDELDRVLAPLGGDAPECMVVDRGPAAIGAPDGVLIDAHAGIDGVFETLEELRRARLFGTQLRPHDLILSLAKCPPLTRYTLDSFCGRAGRRCRRLRLLGPTQRALDPSTAQHPRFRAGIG